MKYVSTRGAVPPVGLSQAIRAGAAPDGGLYVPIEMPAADRSLLNVGMSLADQAAALLRPFFRGDPLEGALAAICREAFDFPAPLVSPDPADRQLRALELFHGPTGAFKDFGARFLMGCLERLGSADEPLTVLAATSGDTGGAVGAAAEGREGVRAVILYPKGRVSPFQERQLTCWGENIVALEVDGDFDECQRLVKAAFADAELVERLRLTSANSINLGRLLPQMVYIAAAALELFEESGAKPGFIIPTGNLGHGVAALYARGMGAPVGPIITATNANRTLLDWHESGTYRPRPSIATIANAMDVGAPSNFERLVKLPEELGAIDVRLVDDVAIRRRIESDYRDFGYLWCPHSATAAEAYRALDDGSRADRRWVVTATAHPYKFADVIEPIIGRPIEPPPMLEEVMSRTCRKTGISATLDGLVAELRG